MMSNNQEWKQNQKSRKEFEDEEDRTSLSYQKRAGDAQNLETYRCMPNLQRKRNSKENNVCSLTMALQENWFALVAEFDTQKKIFARITIF